MCTRRLMTTLVMIASLLVSGQALAQPQLPTFQPGDVLRANDLNAIVEQVKRNMPVTGGSGGTTHTVDCASGGTIAAAMSQAQPGDTVMITGTCNEAVVVDKDGITLDGGGSAVIDGSGVDAAAILVKGYQNVIIKGLTVQNGLNGIKIVESAAAWLEDVTVQSSRDKAGHDSSHGILVTASSSVVMTGTIVANNNAGNGVLVLTSSSAYVLGNFVIEGDRLPRASLQANGNGAAGIQIHTSSSLFVASGDSVPTTLQANNNGGSGILLVDGASAQFGGGADVEASGNEDVGLDVIRGSSAMFTVWPSLGVAARFNSNKGWAGVAVYISSSLSFWYPVDAGGTFTAADNTGVGLGVGQGSSVTFQSALSQATSANLAVFSRNGSFGGVGVYQNSTVNFRMPAEVKNNANDGFNIWGNCFVELGVDSDSAVAVSDNGRNGITALLSSALALDGVTVEDNAGHGIGIYDNSELATFGQATTITGNGRDGISAWNGVGIYLGNTTVTGNTGADVSSGRGSRLGWSNSQVGNVYCDADVLAFDDASCPDEGGAVSEQ